MEERRHEFFYHSQATQWTQIGDKVTGKFFEVAGPRHHCAGVRQLKKPDGTLAIEPNEMREVATDFYRDLLIVDPPSELLDAYKEFGKGPCLEEGFGCHAAAACLEVSGHGALGRFASFAAG